MRWDDQEKLLYMLTAFAAGCFSGYVGHMLVVTFRAGGLAQ